MPKQTTVPDGFIGIYTVNDLMAIKSTGEYILMSDLDLSGIEWTPLLDYQYDDEIGDWVGAFSGFFDGNNHEIRNLTITESGVTGGLFSYVEGGVIANLRLVDVNISSSNGGTGALGYSLCELEGFPDKAPKVSNCYVSGSINSGGYSCGGLFSRIETYGESTITVEKIEIDCTLRGDNVGGLSSLICTNGGVDKIFIDDIDLTVDIIGDPGGRVGGLSCDVYTNGYSGEGTDEIVISRIAVRGRLECYGKDDIGWNGNTYHTPGAVGGLFGQIYTNGDICRIEVRDCYCQAVVIGDKIGGICSYTGNWDYAEFIMRNIYISNSLIVVNEYPYHPADAAFGEVDDWEYLPTVLESCYFNESLNPQGSMYIQGVQEEKLKQKETFLNWDFDKIWIIDEGKVYPEFLKKKRAVITCKRVPLTNYRR